MVLYPINPLTRIIGPLESRVMEKLRFENRVDIQECGLEICHWSLDGEERERE
jgi:hypothetical protein